MRITVFGVLPLLVVLLLEASLRLAGVGYSAGTVVACESEGGPAYCSNLRFTRLFLPEALAPWLGPFVFPAEKPAGTYRIFVLGASAAQGDPQPLYGFWRILDVLLEARYPGVRFEVVNAAAVAVNSHVTRQSALDLARHEPDLFVVYLGNNEVVGPYGASSVAAPLQADLGVIRAGVWARTLRLGQLFEGLWISAAAHRDASRWRGLEAFVGRDVRRDAAALEPVYAHFERNLRDVCQAGRQAGAQVVLATVASNLRSCAPFGSQNRPDLTAEEQASWGRHYREGAAQHAAGNHAAALRSYQQAAGIDGAFAELQFRLAETLWALGDHAEARAAYVLARDHDTLRFRADTRINRIIASVARDGEGEGVYFADVVAAMEAHSPHGVPGHELFWEHVHYRFAGNYLLARTILEQVEAALPEHLRSRRTRGEPLREQQCAERLGYTGWSHAELTRRILEGYVKRAPFTGRFGNAEQVRRLEQQLAGHEAGLEEAAATFQAAVERRPSDWALRALYAELLLAAGDTAAAEEQLRFVVRAVPHHAGPARQLATLLRDAGETREAAALLRRLLNLGAQTEAVHRELGLTLARGGEPAEAQVHLSRALEINPGFWPPYLDLARLLRQQGQLGQAVDVLRSGLESHPRAALHYELAGCLAELGQRRAAVEELQATLRLDPDHGPARETLQKLEGAGPTGAP